MKHHSSFQFKLWHCSKSQSHFFSLIHRLLIPSIHLSYWSVRWTTKMNAMKLLQTLTWRLIFPSGLYLLMCSTTRFDTHGSWNRQPIIRVPHLMAECIFMWTSNISWASVLCLSGHLGLRDRMDLKNWILILSHSLNLQRSAGKCRNVFKCLSHFRFHSKVLLGSVPE